MSLNYLKLKKKNCINRLIELNPLILFTYLASKVGFEVQPSPQIGFSFLLRKCATYICNSTRNKGQDKQQNFCTVPSVYQYIKKVVQYMRLVAQYTDLTREYCFICEKGPPEN